MPGPPVSARAAARAAAAVPRARPLRAFRGMRELADPRGPYLVPLVLLVAVRVTLALLQPYGAEDAYITYRYARNLAGGAGLVYNPGERVMGFTSPLWAVWHALGILLTHQPLLWSRLTAIAADAVTLLGAGVLLERHASRASAWCFACFFAVWPYFPAVAVSGMETSVVLALVVASAALAEARTPLAGVALGALALSRPEGLVAALVLATRAGSRARIVAAAITAAGLAALAAMYGTIVPQPIAAKAGVYGTPGPWAGRGWWEWLLPFPAGHWPSLPDTVMTVPLMALLAPAVVTGARALWPARRTALAAAIAALLVVWLGYAALGVTYFWWYLGLPLAGFALLAAAGLPRIVRGAAVYVALALLVCGVWSMARFLYLGRVEQDARTFGPAAAYLRAHARPGDAALLEPIGRIGWEAPVRVIDEVGLVSPGVARRRLGGPGWYADVAGAERPAWLVVRAGMLRTGAAFAGRGAPFRDAAERDAVFARYAVALGDPGAGDDVLVVLRRVR